jgi:hypothetical protein
MKNASSTSVNAQPPEPYVSVPTTNAATAPPRVKACARHAATAMMPAKVPPTMSC